MKIEHGLRVIASVPKVAYMAVAVIVLITVLVCFQ
jgi:hypothetical protein